MNNNKKKGIIYKIEFGNDLYVGSTKCYYLCERQAIHNSDYRNDKYVTKLLHKKAKENNIDKLKCIFICNFYFNTIEELRQEEEKYRIELNATLNTNKSFTTEEQKKEYQKKYELEHKEHRKAYRKEYRKKYNIKVNCEFCNCETSKDNLKRHQKSKKCLKKRLEYN
tara:strand:+ start:685 stop:1185 length:501 start_codon:yes stop_codon:yes gene_type:complete